MAHREPLSVVLITLNAAHQLEPCLQGAGWAEEILVLDSGSSDGTRELAARYGARVIDHPWLGFGPQKNLAVNEARYDWVLCVDADERISPELRTSIEAALVKPEFRAFRFPRRNRFLGRWLKHGEGYPDWSLRLFDRRRARWSDDPVHEKVVCQEAIGSLQGDLLHESGENLSAYLDKQNRYTSLQAAALFRQGRRTYVAQLVMSPLLRFIKFYFLRLGFLDGVAGLVHILIGCFNSFCKYAKLLAMQKEEQ